MEEERGFKGIWIPAEIWLDERLSPIEKIILMEIDSLDSAKNNGCWASNSYLASFCLCSERKVSEAISKLIKIGYISQEGFNGRTRTLRSRIAKSASVVAESASPGSRKCDAGEQTHYNRIDIDDGYNRDRADKPPRAHRFVSPTVEEVSDYCMERCNNVDAQRFVDYYTANGWKVGKNPMKDWKAAVRTWEKNSAEKHGPADNKEQKKSLSVWDVYQDMVARGEG